MRVIRFARAGVAVLAAIGLFGCGSGVDEGRLTVELTDLPSTYFERVDIKVGAVEAVSLGGNAIVELTGDGGDHNLLELTDGVTATVASLVVPADTYRQLRFVLDEVEVKLASGYSFADGGARKPIVVPSGAQTGIKLNIDDFDDEPGAGVRIASGETILVIDFDVDQNFQIQVSPTDPNVIQNVVFTPLLRATVKNIAGSISGQVTDASGAGVAGVGVKADLTDGGDTLESLQTENGGDGTDDNGFYTIRFLAPGTYTVSADGYKSVTGVVLEKSQDVSGVDLEEDVP